MKKTITKIISITLVVAIMIFSAPLSGFVGIEIPKWLNFTTKASAMESGTCGDGVDWTFDYDTNTLEIFGIGEIYDDYGSFYYSWHDFKDSVHKVIMSENVVTIGTYAFEGFTNLTDVTTYAQEIRTSAFENCCNLKNLTLGDGVSIIRGRAFYECDGLVTLNMPESISEISGYAFAFCSSLESVYINGMLPSIRSKAFDNCPKLNYVYINDAYRIDGDAFSYCSNLANIEIGNLESKYHYIDDCGALYHFSKYNNIQYLDLVMLPSGSQTDIYQIPDGCTSIYAYAFSGNNNIRSVLIPSSVTEIGDFAFSGCSQFTDIYYCGSHEQWDSVIVSNYNNELFNATKHYNCRFSNGVIATNVSSDSSVTFNANVIDDGFLSETNNNYILSSDIIIPYDIHLHQDGNQVQPDGTVTVRIPVPDNVNPNNCKVFYIDENGNEIDMNATYNNGYMEFQTNHFSIYVVAANYFRIELSPFKNQIRFDKDSNGEYIGSFDYRTIIELKGLNEIFEDVDDIVDGTDGDCIIESGYLFNIYNGIDFETAMNQIQGGDKVYAQVQNSYISTSTISGSYAMSCLILDVPDSEVYTELTTLAYVVYLKDGEIKYAFYETTHTFEDLYNEYFDKAFPA